MVFNIESSNMNDSTAETLTNIDGGRHLEDDWGERFRGWYLIRTPLEKHNAAVEGETTYDYPVSDYQFKFYMPAMFSFSGGFITYSDDHRKLGIFRFPRDENGSFVTPIKWAKEKTDLVDLTDEEVAELLRAREVVTFESFRVPMFGFEYLDLSEEDFQALVKLSSSETVEAIRRQYEDELQKKKDEVKSEILSRPNYLVLLQGILDLRRTDLNTIASLTNNIITASR